jgi:cardiolipin synthase
VTTENVYHRDVDTSSAVARARRTLEGVVGIPATEGNRIDVLRNGCRIFPAMLDAINGAQHTVDFLTFVYWKGEIGTARAFAFESSSTRLARDRSMCT